MIPLVQQQHKPQLQEQQHDTREATPGLISRERKMAQMFNINNGGGGAKKKKNAFNLRAAVALPQGEDLNEWIAANIVDFFNEVSLLYGLCAEDAQKFSKPGEGFPPGFEYRWADGEKITKPMRCSSPEYVDYVMTWVEDQINNEGIFPVKEGVPFPSYILTHMKNIFKRLFRVFAIMYHHHFPALEEKDAAGHLNSVFKHFVFFAFEFKLLDDKETHALAGPMGRLKEQFEQ